MLVKIYGPDPEQEQKRYSFPKMIETQRTVIMGNPKPKYISTSYAERQNPTNGFSKKVENHAHAISLHFMYYNFCRIHQTLRVTPAMEAKVTDRLWGIKDIIDLIN